MPETRAADSMPPATDHTRTETEDAHRAPSAMNDQQTLYRILPNTVRITH
jgi:hypothetical protein